MSIVFPADRKEVSDRAKTDVQAALPVTNPFLKNSYLAAIIIGYSGRVYDFYLQLKRLILEIFPNTADGPYLQMWGELVEITQNPATQSTGVITATGNVGVVIPFLSPFVDSSGAIYTSQSAASITANSMGILSMTRSGNTATVMTNGDHPFASGMTITIAGADQTDYNGPQVITVTETDQFTFQVQNTPVTPATGATITAAANCVSISVISNDTGAATNLDSGTQLSILNPIAGINNTAYVQFGELAGGTDLESTDDLRARIIYRYANPVSLFNVAAIVTQAEKVAGVTRVFVEEITPYPGATTIYFTRDNDTDIIPSSPEVAAVRAQLLLIKPASMKPDDLIVSAPTPIEVDFAFTSLSPNTSTMQAAIIANLEVLFRESTNVGADLLALAYNASIFQTVDTVTGSLVTDFALSAPAGDVSIAAGQIPVLGTVTFP